MKFLLSVLVCFIMQLSFVAQNNNDLKADINVDDLGDVSDVFQEHFFEALKQKGIENYNRALEALNVCLEHQPNNASVHFELGKNYSALKRYNTAEASLKKALQLKPNSIAILKTLYTIQFNQQDWKNAITTVKLLVQFDPIYKEDLAKLYHRTKDYDMAITQLDELDKRQGNSRYRDSLRQLIYNQSDAKENLALGLEKRIASTPENIQNYINLIYVYSIMNMPNKAFETALQLHKVHPNVDAAHLALYKGYLDKGQVDLAITSMKVVLQSNQVDKETKGKVLKDFMQYSTNTPQISEDVNAIITSSANTTDPKLLALFYLEQHDNQKALQYFTEALTMYPTDFEVLKHLALLQLDAQRFTETVLTTKNAIAIYPSQPIFYLLQGVANNNLKAYKSALESLEMGIDYSIDNPKIELDFFTQMSIAHKALGNNTRAFELQQRAEKIKTQLN